MLPNDVNRAVPWLLSVAMLIVMVPLSRADACPVEASFTGSGTPSSSDMVRLREGASNGNLVTVHVMIAGPTTSADIYAFAFDLVLSDPAIARFVEDSAVAGPALVPGSCLDVLVLAVQREDRVVVGVTKLGCSGNGIPNGEETIVSLDFRLLQPGSTTIGFWPSAITLDSETIPISSISFDPLSATLAGTNTPDSDDDGILDCIDSCPMVFNLFQEDHDGDLVGDACDNCIWDPNVGQSDFDQDGEGDHCDLDDGLIYQTFQSSTFLGWQEETGSDAWSLYRGDLDVLVSEGTYTQVVGSNPTAARLCDLGAPFVSDGAVPDEGQTFHYLVAGVAAGAEGDLGADSDGIPRPNDAPCVDVALEVVSIDSPHLTASD